MEARRNFTETQKSGPKINDGKRKAKDSKLSCRTELRRRESFYRKYKKDSPTD